MRPQITIRPPILKFSSAASSTGPPTLSYNTSTPSGQAEAIAAGMFKMFELTVPTISVVIGEGGSGGAIGIATSSRVLMLEHSVYSVIPPEGCAAILWRAPEKGDEAAKALKLTAQSALEFGIIDEIIPEPMGGAHRDWVESASSVKDAIGRHLADLDRMTSEAIYADRHRKFAAMGKFFDPGV